MTAAAAKFQDLVVEPLVKNNPIALQILGICSALAVTSSVSVTLVMCAALTSVLVCSNTAISAIREHVPSNIRIIVQMTIIASLVILVDQVLQAFAYEFSKQLSVFVGLIITNCIVMGRAEAFAMQNPPIPSFFDGLGNALGYSVILLVVASFREVFGAGTFMGYDVFAPGWYISNGLLLNPASSFFVIGAIIWVVRQYDPEQIEELDAPVILPTED